ncbi:MAG TPA: RnfABCDGE type electron transport complex subunit B [Burkholderiales bacterium]
MTTATHEALAEKLDAALPQTQCTRCGYPRCKAYARALANGGADIDQCPPGGDATIRLLARLLGVEPKPLDPAFGKHEPRRRAVIDESRCIGCRKCIDACPVDAIVGARKWMHTVIAAQCSGCELCVPPCPVDCIDLVAVPPATSDGPWPEYARGETDVWRIRTAARAARLVRPRTQPRVKTEPSTRRDQSIRAIPTPETIRAEIAAAVARVRRRRSSSSG